jgi:hypothetical protein
MSKGVGGRLAVAAAVGLFGAASIGRAATGGNSFYQIAVEDAPAGVGLGVYTVTTGALHPIVGPLGTQNILFGGGVPGTSFTTIRSYTSGTDYVQRNGLTLGAGAPLTLALEGYVAAGEEAAPIGNPLNPAGFTTTYRPGGFAPAPDNLVIRQTASVIGSTFNDSAVELRTEITNTGGAPVAVGVRYLWDTQIGPNDDGPSFRTLGPGGPPLPTDMVFFNPTFTSFEITDNNDPASCFGVGNSPFPFFSVQGSVTGPAALHPTSPTRLGYVSWPNVSGLAGKFGGVIPATNAFDYPTLGVDISTCLITVDDTGVAYWWGDVPANALTIAPGATVSVSAFIYAFLPGMPPAFTPPGVEGPPGDPTCSDGVDNDGDGLVDMNDPDCVTPPNHPPDCSAATPSARLLWPPNHKFRAVRIGGVTDADNDPITITVNSIDQDEPLNALGDGNTCPDAGGAGGETAFLRVERSGASDGRVYHVDFTADDGRGGQCSGTVSVCVPHDQGKGKSCVDQGALFDSTGPCVGKPRRGNGRP